MPFTHDEPEWRRIMVERKPDGNDPGRSELRIAIAREVLSLLLASAGIDLLTLPPRPYVEKAVQFADALLEALGEGQ